MADSENQKKLNVQVMDEMRKNGSFFDLHARLLANLSEEVQKSDIDGLKPYKRLRTEEQYKCAEECVLRYLENHKMVNTIRAIQAESHNAFKRNPEKSAEIILDIDDCEDPIQEVLADFKQNMSEIFYNNRDDLRAELSQRLQNVYKKSK